MNDRFNEKAELALNNSLTFARDLGHTYIGSEHLLLALSNIPNSAATKLLESKGYSYRVVREAVIAVTGSGMRTTLTSSQMTPRLKRILERADKTASEAKSEKIGTEHLLFALLEEKEGMAYRVLIQLDASTSDLRSDLLSHMSGGKRIKGRSLYTPISNVPNLSAFGKDITALAAEGKLDPVIGRDKETDRVIQILLRRSKNNPCLIGEPGVGKTAIVEGLAARIVNGDIPSLLQGRTIFSLDLTAMIAGAKYRGEFEDRLKSVMAELKRHPSIILFIDELHTVVGAGSAEGAIDAANILKPPLSRGEIHVIGATTIQEYRKHIEKDAALERRFQPLMVEEPSVNSAIEILEGLKEHYELHHGVNVSDEALRAAVLLTQRYMPDRFLPDKAIDVLDETCARVRLSIYSCVIPRQDDADLVRYLRKCKEDAILSHDYATASCYREQELRILSGIPSPAGFSQDGGKFCSRSSAVLITEQDIAKTIEEHTGIPLCDQESADSHATLSNKLKKHVLGQDSAIDSIVRAIRRNQIGIRDPKRPIGCFLFAGPTGVGKTELCRILSAELYHDNNAFIQLNMSEYAEAHSISKLIGSPPGYIGFDDGGQLTEKVRRKPYSLIVFDEIDKAHPDIYNLLLQIMDEGSLQDSHGKTVDFRNTLIVLTSNLGNTNESKKALGFTSDGDEASNAKRERAMERIRTKFRPELLNRLDEIILFSPIDRLLARKITSLFLEQLQKRLESIGIYLAYDSLVLELLTSLAYDPRFGARAIRRTITREIEDRVAEELSLREYKRPLSVDITTMDGQITLKIKENT